MMQLSPNSKYEQNFVKFDRQFIDIICVSLAVACRVFDRSPLKPPKADAEANVHVLLAATTDLDQQLVQVSQRFIVLTDVAHGVDKCYLKYVVANHARHVVSELYFATPAGPAIPNPETQPYVSVVVMFSPNGKPGS